MRLFFFFFSGRRRHTRFTSSWSSDVCSSDLQRSRGTARVCNRLLRRVRDYAEVEADGVITDDVADQALNELNVDNEGLDAMDRRILTTLMDTFNGGPAGLQALAASLAEDLPTLESHYEPFLLQRGFIARTPRGRVATRQAYEHLDRHPPATAAEQATLPSLTVIDAHSTTTSCNSFGQGSRSRVPIFRD